MVSLMSWVVDGPAAVGFGMVALQSKLETFLNQPLNNRHNKTIIILFDILFAWYFNVKVESHCNWLL